VIYVTNSPVRECKTTCAVTCMARSIRFNECKNAVSWLCLYLTAHPVCIAIGFSTIVDQMFRLYIRRFFANITEQSLNELLLTIQLTLTCVISNGETGIYVSLKHNIKPLKSLKIVQDYSMQAQQQQQALVPIGCKNLLSTNDFH
jgi:hypothetical protein